MSIDFSAFPKRTNDLPPLESESESENENIEPNKANFECSSKPSLERAEKPPKIDKKEEEDEKLDQYLEMPGKQMLDPKSVLKRTFTTPSADIRMKPAMLKSHSRSDGVLHFGCSTVRKKSPVRLQVVRSLAPPKNFLSARQLFTSNGREILGDTKKTMLTIKNTPSIFRGLLASSSNDTLENSSLSQIDETDDPLALEETISKDEPHYSRIFDVSVAVERSLPDVDMEQFSRVLEERRPQLVERVAELREGMLKQMCKLEKGIEKLALTPKYNFKDKLKPHPMSPFKETETPPFAIYQPPPPPKKIADDLDDEKCNMKTFVTVEGKKYLLCQNLGKGGSGYVFECCAAESDSKNNGRYAIKVIFKKFNILT